MTTADRHRITGVTEPASFDVFAASLPAPDIAEAIHGAEPLDDPVAFRFPTSVRHRYEHLRAFPDGLLVIGDAVSSLLGSCMDGPLAALFVRHNAALSRADGTELDAVAASFADLGYLLLAVDASAQAAHIHRARGRIGSATIASARARELIAHCETHARGARASHRSHRVDAAREGTGSTRCLRFDLSINRPAARNLRPHQVYTKLGVTGRSNLRVSLAPMMDKQTAVR